MMTERENVLNDLQVSIQRFNHHSGKLKSISRRISIYRLILFLISVFTAVVLFLQGKDLYAWIMILIFVLLFGIISSVQNKVETAYKKTAIWINLKELHTARILHDWKNIPYKDYHQVNEEHLFEEDLNLTGKHSLLHLIDYTNSVQGNRRLKEWLLTETPDLTKTRQRQGIVKELAGLEKFRNKLLLSSRLISKNALDGDKILKNIKSDNHYYQTSRVLPVLLAISFINIILVILYYLHLIPPFFIISVSAYAALYFFNSRFVSDLFDKITDVETDLGKFVPVLDFLERYHYGKNDNLSSLCSVYIVERPSYYFMKLHWIINAVSFQKNPFLFMIFNSLFPWDFYFANKFEKIKLIISDKLENWLDVWYELEALISLANLKAYHPHYSFPELTAVDSSEDSSLFKIKEAGHPLIPYEHNIKNSLTLNKTGEALIITGSNMSGKSTFLKTIGTNLVLAYAGGPVYATSFSVSLLRLKTCIKISDSVTEGISYFYAEVKRLKKILDEVKKDKEYPVLYLIDEIFKGTNNIERITGSRSYIKTIAGLNCLGLITTHDLELVKLEQEISGIKNFHFREETEGNKMIFDYKLREGPCPTTNALKIMMIEGLPVSYP